MRLRNFRIEISKIFCVEISVAGPHHFYAAPGKNFYAAPAAPAPTFLYSKTKFLNRTKV
jgi:hypothetical protein